MAVSEIGNSAGNYSGTIIKKGTGGGDLDETDFMMLLIEQMKNQDPLNPMENSAFTAHLAQFSSLEEMRKMNGTLEDILLTQASLNNAAAVNLIGKTIEAKGNEVVLTADGTEINYMLPQDAVSVAADIYDADNQLVAALTELPMQKGQHTVQWDGTDDEGAPLPAGSYSFRITAEDSSGNSVDVTELMIGEATDLIFEEDGTYLYVNGKRVTLSDILKVTGT